jgi:polyisoprenoid-binding protein YceI
MKPFLRPLIFLTLLIAPAPGAPAQSIYSFDASGGSLEIDVYREGLFKAFGHNHRISAREFSGRVLLDGTKIAGSSVTLRVAVKSLAVLDPGESARDRQSVQITMLGEKVLDAAQFPEIVFTSSSVTRAEKLPDGWRILLAGTLQLHGRAKLISIPLTLRLSQDGMDAQGEIELAQSDYGIPPIQVAGGAVKVKNLLRIRFLIHARAAASS